MLRLLLQYLLPLLLPFLAWLVYARLAHRAGLRDAPWIGGFHPVSYGLVHSWMKNGKPNNMARNNLKYLRLDVAERAAKRLEWNRPVLWPLAVIVLLLAAVMVPAVAAYRRRERMAARPLPGKSGSDPNTMKIGV